MSFAASENLRRGQFLQPPTSTKVQESPAASPSSSPSRSPSPSPSPSKTVRFSETPQPTKARRRQANVYDAVAGRVTARGFVQAEPSASKYRDTASSGARIRRPEEILFRPDHPMRQTEQSEAEPYFAHENLPASCPLPSSDLLQSIHAYTSDFYKYTLGDGGRSSHYSMNESALLAMGILVEELAKESLGEQGDLVLIEPQGKKGEISGNPADYVRKRGRRPGWRAHIDGQRPKAARRNPSPSNDSARRKRPRLSRAQSTASIDTANYVD